MGEWMNVFLVVLSSVVAAEVVEQNFLPLFQASSQSLDSSRFYFILFIYFIFIVFYFHSFIYFFIFKCKSDT